MQLVQAVDADEENVPAIQLRQVTELLAPFVGEYMPALQFKQKVDDPAPIDDEYVPATQFRQVTVEVAASDAEYVPGPHERQTEGVFGNGMIVVQSSVSVEPSEL